MQLIHFITVLANCFNYISTFDPRSSFLLSHSPNVPYQLFSSRDILAKSGDVPLLNRKVFGVRSVKIEEQPYMVSIKRNVSHYLTGTLISSCIVLTVARPLTGVPTYELGVVAGETYNDRGNFRNDVLFVAIHPHYNRVTLNNNIAMLRIHTSYIYTVSTKPVLFPVDDTSIYVNHKFTAFVSGWGRCDETGRELCLPRSSKYYPNEIFDPVLKTFEMVFNTSNPYCVKGYVNERALTMNHDCLCQGVAREENPMAPCLAVPGAPMVINGKIVAILSWGLGCGYKGDLPLVYTDLYHHRSWIVITQNILETIPKEFLDALHDATNAYMLNQEYFRQLMSYNNKHIRPPEDLVFHKSYDEVVASIPAKVYDMRDFVFNKMYHQEKKSFYYKLLRTAKSMLYLKNLPYAERDTQDNLFSKCLWTDE